MKTVAIIQARMGSTRLPGKVLMNLCGRSVLSHVVGRVRAAPLVDEIVVATTDRPGDDPIVAEAGSLGAQLFRGNEDDVLSRYYLAAVQYHAETVVRVTADCPLFDGDVLQAMLQRFIGSSRGAARIDYLSNTLVRTFPRGLDAEIFTFAVLEQAHRQAGEQFEREHVTPYIYRHPELFVLQNFVGELNLAQHRWTLDTIEDWRLIEAIYDSLTPTNEMFGMRDVLKLLRRRPDLIALNAHIEQKHVEQKSTVSSA